MRDRLAALRVDLEARAAGYWWLAGDWLEQVGFAPSPTLDEEVSRGFADATLSVPLERTDLGIVRAALEGQPAVSRVGELPGDAGSGYWLRAFGASRSVAVPIRDARGTIRAVVSVALADSPLDDETVAARIAEQAQPWVVPG